MKYVSNDKIFLEFISENRITVHESGIVVNNKTGSRIGQKTPFIVLIKDNIRYGIPTYRLVWIAFKGLIPEGYLVYRIDAYKGCRLSNLEIKTAAQKNKEIGTGHRFTAKPGSSNNQARFTDEQVLLLRREYKANPFSIRAKAKELGTSHPILAMALKGKSYAYLPDAVTEISKKFAGSRKGTVRNKSNSVAKPTAPRKPRPKVERPKVEKVKAELPKTKTKPKEVKPSPVEKVPMTAAQKKDRLELIKSLTKKLRKTGYDI